MASIYPVTIPKWGIEMQEGTITQWRCRAGDTVSKGEELVDIESDKIVNTMEAPVSGVLQRIVAEVDETLKVGQLLAVIAEEGVSEADIDAFIDSYVPADAAFGIDDDNPAPAPSTAAAAEPPPSTGDAAPESSELSISPVARRLANKLGVDISRVQGSGRNGRISTQDIEAAAAADAGAQDTAGQPAPLSGRALSAARRMVEAKQTIPHFYLQRELDMRAALAAKQREGVALTALLLKAMADAMQAQPLINAHFANDALLPQRGVSINVAVDTPEGLVAPLLSDCDQHPAAALAGRLKALAERARKRELQSADLQPGGITLSNLGMFGISQFSAIINPPQVAILAIGCLRRVELEPDVGLVPVLSATLSCDHRAIDGAAGARFLSALQDALNAL